MNDRRQLAFEQSQKPKARKRSYNKLKKSKPRRVGTSAKRKQKKFNDVNKTILNLEKSCKDLLKTNAELRARNVVLIGEAEVAVAMMVEKTQEIANLTKALQDTRARNIVLNDEAEAMSKTLKDTQAEADNLRAENEFE